MAGTPRGPVSLLLKKIGDRRIAPGLQGHAEILSLNWMFWKIHAIAECNTPGRSTVALSACAKPGHAPDVFINA
jgi:hypothetical protein